jgi:hypothetical protein
VLLTPHERTKLTAQSIECIFLGHSTKNKGYCYWDTVAHRIQTSQDVVFDESYHFYPHPTTDASSASLVDPCLSYFSLMLLLLLCLFLARLYCPLCLVSSGGFRLQGEASSDTVLQSSWCTLVRCSSFLG